MTGPKPNDECEHEIYAHCIECGTTFERHPTDCISIAWVEELEMKVDELKSMAEFHLNHCKVTSSNYISIAEVEKMFGCSFCEAKAVKDCWSRHPEDVMLTGDSWKKFHETMKK